VSKDLGEGRGSYPSCLHRKHAERVNPPVGEPPPFAFQVTEGWWQAERDNERVRREKESPTLFVLKPQGTREKEGTTLLVSK